MDFNLSSEQIAFQQTASQFAEKALAPNAAHWDQTAEFPVDVIRQAGELGFCGLYAPEHAGGLGLTRLDASIILEELSYGCTATAAYISIHNMCTWMLCNFADEKLIAQWGEKLCSGELLASYCLTEPDAGSDAASIKTHAKLVDDSFIINGSKVFISGAGASNILILMTKTNENEISCFLVPANSEGISYGKKEEKMGWNAQPTRQINFEDVKIPKSNLIGKQGQGFKIAMMGLDGGRINIATCSLGTAQAAIDHTQAYMLERKQFGKSLSQFQALQFKLADMVTELVAARQMVRLAASKLDEKSTDATTYCAMAKRFATDVGFKVCNDALQIHGGYGYMKEFPLERYMRDSRVHQILEGSNEIMNVIIARRLLLEDATKAIK